MARSSQAASAAVLKGRYLASRFYQRIEKYIHLTRLNRPIGIFLLLWPTLWAIWIASKGKPGFLVPTVFVLGVILMRSAGCVINDLFDRKYDGKVKRTKDRPIATGRVHPVTALIIFVVLSLVAFSLVLLFLNTYVMYLSFVAVALAVIYPLMKRFTHLPQVVLGMAFAMAVPMAFAQYRNDVPLEAWVMFIGTVLWATAYDTMYALIDKDDDVKIGVKSTAILFGDMFRFIIGLIQALVILAILFVGDLSEINSTSFYISLAVASLLAGYQLYLIHDRDRDKCLKAFLNNNWYGFAIFLGIYYHYIIDQGHLFAWWSLWISACILSIVVIYMIALLKKANRAFWVFAGMVIGPLAVPLVLFARRQHR